MFEFGTVYVCTHIRPMPTCGGPKKLFPNTHFCCLGPFFFLVYTLATRVCLARSASHLGPTTHVTLPVTYFSSPGRISTFSSPSALGIPWFVSWQTMIISPCHLFQLSWKVHGIELMSNSRGAPTAKPPQCPTNTKWLKEIGKPWPIEHERYYVTWLEVIVLRNPHRATELLTGG